ncbi:MAG TPA: hypothetical protein VF221_17870 [Chloroflexota bacterium]
MLGLRRRHVIVSTAAFAAVLLGMGRGADASGIYTTGDTGYDISWPQCGGTYPATPFGFGIVGVTDGRANTQNPCLASEYAWAKGGSRAPSVYMNLNYPSGKAPCQKRDTTCLMNYANTYGYNAAQAAWTYAQSQGATSTMWWLDIETANTWSSKTSLNAQVIQGALTFLQSQSGVIAGAYSTPYQWGVIAGSYAPGVPVWSAGAPSTSPSSYCTKSFGGGSVWLTQYSAGSFDGDYAC